MDDSSPAVVLPFSELSEVPQTNSNGSPVSSTENPPTIATSTLLDQSILPQTFLSPPVFSLLTQSAITSSTEYGNSIIDNNLHLNWDAIEKVLSTKITRGDHCNNLY